MYGHHHIIHFLKNRELNELYVSVAIKSFALAISGIFIPIYLLKLDYTLTAVLLFYVILSVAHIVCIVPAAKIASKYGFKHAILFSTPFLIIFYILLFSLDSVRWPLYALASIHGIYTSLYWVGFHIDFAKFSKTKQRGKEVGISRIFMYVARALGPLIGGLIIALSNFQVVFIIVPILLIISVIPLFFSKDVHVPIKFSIKQIFVKQKVRDSIALIGNGIESGAQYTIWPIFIFFTILNNVTALGFVHTLSFVFSLIATLFISKFVDAKRRTVLKIGSIANGIVWGLRTFVKTASHVFFIDSIYGITSAAAIIPFEALSYDKASKSNIVKYTIFREIFLYIGRISIYGGMIFITKTSLGFVFASGASFLQILF